MLKYFHLKTMLIFYLMEVYEGKVTEDKKRHKIHHDAFRNPLGAFQKSIDSLK